MLGIKSLPSRWERARSPGYGSSLIRVMSMALLLESADTSIVWRGPMKMKALEQFLSEVAWGPLDYLLIDSPLAPETSRSASCN